MSKERFVRIADVMTPSVRTIARTATAADAIKAMREFGVSSLAVERRNDGDEFGLVVVSDIAREVIAQERAPDRVSIYEIMSKPAVTLPKEMNIKYAVRLLARFGLSRALVVDETRTPVGIVTLRDMVLRHLEE